MTQFHLFIADHSFDLAPTAIERSNYKPPRRLSGGKINQNKVFMQNKPNLCVFWAVSGDYEKKQTQTNPIQTQNKPNFDLSAPIKAKTNPIQTQFQAKKCIQKTKKSSPSYASYPF